MEYEHETPRALADRTRGENLFFRRVGDALAEIESEYDLVVVDCPPQLANLMFNEFRTNLLHRVPTRMSRGLRQEIFAVDHDMSQFAAENFIDYVSPTSILCNPEGCLTRLGDTGNTIMQWDSAHLTAEGSIYLVSRFALNTCNSSCFGALSTTIKNSIAE